MKDPTTSNPRSLQTRSHFLSTLVASGLALSVGTTAGTGVSSAAPHPQSRQAPITVLVDSLRLPMVKAYEKANPSVKLDVELGDAGANGDGSIESKVALANRVGHGWPDIIFSAEANDVQKLGVAPFNFPAVLNQGRLLPRGLTKHSTWPSPEQAGIGPGFPISSPPVGTSGSCPLWSTSRSTW
jgi:hypothetical protein